MFAHLLAKECHQTLRSMIYWLIVVIMVIFFSSQMGSMEIEEKPEPGEESYGFTHGGDENATMEATLGYLISEYSTGTYTTYPIGFYKTVTPNEEEQQRIGEIVAETTGFTSAEDIEDAMAPKQEGTNIVYGSSPVQPKAGLTYERFEELMKEADGILGGGSYYSEESIQSNARTPKTYEDALKEYHDLIEKDGLTGGYARLFSDYMGIVLGILPVFLAATRGLRDRRTKMQELIASRKASSAMIIGSRYLSMLVMLLLPVLILSFIPLTECIQSASKLDLSVDYLAFVKYSFGWLLPTIMMAAAVGMALTELTDTALGVLVQLIFWFLSIFSSMSGMGGGQYGFCLIPRHNTVFNYAGFHAGFKQLMMNRALYAILSVLLVVLTMWIYSLKRKGRLDIRGKILANRKRKHEA